jgi:hypothetical protein
MAVYEWLGGFRLTACRSADSEIRKGPASCGAGLSLQPIHGSNNHGQGDSSL